MVRRNATRYQMSRFKIDELLNSALKNVSDTEFLKKRLQQSKEEAKRLKKVVDNIMEDVQHVVDNPHE